MSNSGREKKPAAVPIAPGASETKERNSFTPPELEHPGPSGGPTLFRCTNNPTPSPISNTNKQYTPEEVAKLRDKLRRNRGEIPSESLEAEGKEKEKKSEATTSEEETPRRGRKPGSGFHLD